MSNKKVLSQATRGLNKTKAPSKPRDIIYDPMGQWAHPGQPTRIPGNNEGTNITMGPNPETGTPITYPVWAQPNVGQPQMMYPGQDYNFPEADYVDEYPQMKRGGLKKNKTSRNLMATNKLFAKHAFFKKPKKNVIFDPNSPNFQDGGFILELDDDEIQAYKDGGYIVEDISVPELQYGGEEPKLNLDLPEQAVYGNEEKRKLQGSLIDKYTQAKKAYQDYRENAGLSKQRLKSEGASSIGVLKGQVKEYKSQLEEEKKSFERAQKALNVLKKKDPENWKDKKLKDVMSPQGVDALRSLYKDGKMSDASFKDFYDNFGNQYDREATKTTADDQVKLEDSWYGKKDEQGRRRWMSNPMNVKKVAQGVAMAAPLAPFAPAVLANPLVQAGLTGYGVYDATTNTLPAAYRNYQQGEYAEMAGNLGMAALDLAPIPLVGTNVLDDVVDVGKYLTTKTPLKNAYKINPYALKENPEMYVYRARPVGQNPDMNMAATLRAKEAAGEPLNWMQKNIIKMSEGTVPDMGGVAAREKYYGRWFDSDPKNLDYYINPDTRNFADNDAIEILRSKLPRAEADKLKVSQFEDAKSLSGFPERELILPKDKINAAEKFPESSWQQLIQEDEAFNKPHWLKGFGSKTDNSGLTQAGLGSGLFDFISGAKNINKNTKAVSKIDDDLLEAYNLAADLKRQGKISKLPDTPEGFDNWLQSQYNQRPIYRVVDVNQDVVNNPVIKNNMIKQGLDPNNEYHVAEYMGTSVAPAEVINRGRRSGGHDELLKGSNKDILYFAEDPSWIGPRYGGNNPYYVKTFADELPTGYKNQVLGLRSNSRMKKNYSRNYPGFDINQVPSGVLFEDKVLSVGPNTITPILGDKGAKVRKVANIVKGSDFDRLPNKRFKRGGYVDAELTPKEIEWYKSQGYTIEEL